MTSQSHQCKSNRFDLTAVICLLVGLLGGSESLATTVFGLKSCGSANPPICSAGAVQNSLPPTSLYSFAADNPVATFNDLGPVQRGDSDLDVDGLAISGNDLYAFELTKAGEVTTASTLVTIDSNTAQSSIVQTTLNGRDIRGAMFNAAGTLLVIDADSNELLSVDTTTGMVIGAAIGLMMNGQPYDTSDALDIAFNAAGILYLGDVFDLFTLDPNSGVLTQVFTETNAAPDTSVPAFTGLAFTDGLPVDALLTYDVQFDEDIFRYDIDAAFARTQLLSNILNSVNAGRGDLAANVTIVPVPPAVALLMAPVWLMRIRRQAGSYGGYRQKPWHL